MSFFQFEICLSLNFDYFDINLSIPQIAATPESELNITFDFPSSCFFIIVGGKYLNKIGSVMEKVNNITTDIGGIHCGTFRHVSGHKLLNACTFFFS